MGLVDLLLYCICQDLDYIPDGVPAVSESAEHRLRSLNTARKKRQAGNGHRLGAEDSTEGISLVVKS